MGAPDAPGRSIAPTAPRLPKRQTDGGRGGGVDPDGPGDRTDRPRWQGGAPGPEAREPALPGWHVVPRRLRHLALCGGDDGPGHAEVRALTPVRRSGAVAG